MGRFGLIDPLIDPALEAAIDWQTRLLADGIDALPEFLAAYLDAVTPDADLREFKLMVRKARTMRRAGTPFVLLRHLRALESRRRDAEAATGSLDTMDRG